MKLGLVLVALLGLVGSEANPTAFKHGKKTNGPADITEPEYTEDQTQDEEQMADKSSKESIQKSLGIGPDAAEYAQRAVKALAKPTNPANPKNLEQVQDYVDLMQVNEMEKKSTVLLEVQETTVVNRGLEKDGFETAQLVSDLEESMKHLNKDEKRVGKNVDTMFVSLSSRQFKPETAPADLPENLRQAFHSASRNYELQFQKHFANSLPHPSSYLSSSHSPNTVLLESTTVATTGKSSVSAKTNGGPLPTTGSPLDPSGLNYDGTSTGFLDPYAFVTPATMTLSQPSGIAAGYGPGMGGLSTFSNPVASANNQIGVQAPPPPVRPDGLPPVPYVQPDATAGAGVGAEGGAGAEGGGAE